MKTMRSAKLEDQFVGEGYHTLCLRIDELIQLQEKLGAGPNVIAERLLRGEWLVDDIRETVRLGLIGGGMPQKDAFDLVKRCVKEGHLLDFTSIAANTLYAALAGVEDEPMPGETEAPTTTETIPSGE